MPLYKTVTLEQLNEALATSEYTMDSTFIRDKATKEIVYRFQFYSAQTPFCCGMNELGDFAMYMGEDKAMTKLLNIQIPKDPESPQYTAMVCLIASRLRSWYDNLQQKGYEHYNSKNDKEVEEVKGYPLHYGVMINTAGYGISLLIDEALTRMTDLFTIVHQAANPNSGNIITTYFAKV
jgi:hypothetical protein